MTTETIYIGRDNRIDMILKSDDEAVDLSLVTKIEIDIDGVVISSENWVSDPVLWNREGYDTGEIRMILGLEEGLTASAAKKKAYITVYDASNTHGIVWGWFPVKVTDEPEPVTP
jgi:hypothetical protein